MLEGLHGTEPLALLALANRVIADFGLALSVLHATGFPLVSFLVRTGMDRMRGLPLLGMHWPSLTLRVAVALFGWLATGVPAELHISTVVILLILRPSWIQSAGKALASLNPASILPTSGQTAGEQVS